MVKCKALGKKQAVVAYFKMLEKNTKLQDNQYPDCNTK